MAFAMHINRFFESQENNRVAFENNWVACSELFLQYAAGILFIMFLKVSKL